MNFYNFANFHTLTNFHDFTYFHDFRNFHELTNFQDFTNFHFFTLFLGFTIGIVIGALTVILLIVLFIFGYRWHSRRGDITKALYIPKPRPASSQVHLTLVPAGSHYPYENPTQRIGGNPGFNQPRPLSSIYQPNGIGQLHPIGTPITKESQEGTYSSTQDSLGETSCGSDLTYLEPNHGGVVEV
jgi:hypothetical protein